MTLTRAELLSWLREADPARLEELWARADQVRRAGVGDEVHRRGLIEISNHCVRACCYCGLRAANTKVSRYRMSDMEILEAARDAAGFGYGTLWNMVKRTIAGCTAEEKSLILGGTARRVYRL